MAWEDDEGPTETGGDKRRRYEMRGARGPPEDESKGMVGGRGRKAAPAAAAASLRGDEGPEPTSAAQVGCSAGRLAEPLVEKDLSCQMRGPEAGRHYGEERLEMRRVDAQGNRRKSG